jgi:RNA polymerase sigma-70 factor, ECF subfamily
MSAVSASFDELFQASYRRVLAYCRRRTDPDAAADAVAETYAVAWRRRRDLPGDEQEAIAWLVGVARRVLLQRQRAEARRTRLTMTLRSLRATVQHHTDDHDAEDYDDVRLAIADLPAEDAELIRLAYWDELTHRQIGVVLGISEGAVSVRLHRIRAKVRDRLTALTGDQEPEEIRDAH